VRIGSIHAATCRPNAFPNTTTRTHLYLVATQQIRLGQSGKSFRLEFTFCAKFLIHSRAFSIASS
jgi:hypothetical protein